MGKPPDLDAPIWNYFDAAETQSWEDVRKKQITIRHLLTMTSGLDASNYGNETVMQQQSRGDWVGYMLDAPQSQTPGKGFEYHSGAMNLLVGLAETVSGQSTQNLLRQYFFDPMAIAKTYFYHDPSGRLYGAGDGAMRPRDLLKLGMLVADGGQYNKQIILTEKTVSAMLATAVAKLPWSERGLQYGFLWYLRDFDFSGEKVRSYQARGAGGQLIVVIPAWDLVWVITGGNYLDLRPMQASMVALMHALNLARMSDARGADTQTP